MHRVNTAVSNCWKTRSFHVLSPQHWFFLIMFQSRRHKLTFLRHVRMLTSAVAVCLVPTEPLIVSHYFRWAPDWPGRPCRWARPCRGTARRRSSGTRAGSRWPWAPSRCRWAPAPSRRRTAAPGCRLVAPSSESPPGGMPPATSFPASASWWPPRSYH